MAQKSSVPVVEGIKRWVVLIGINYYLQNRPLKGCVRDVEAMEQYIRSGCQTDELNISVLTASYSTDASKPKEDIKRLPTYDNLIDCLKRILAESTPEDVVYIHYSGHGTRIPHNGDLALVLYDGEQGTRLLHGQILSSVLERMTAKGLYVSLALDCCFSGTILRGDDRSYTGIREIPYNSVNDAASDQLFERSSSISYSEPLRDGNIPPRWLTSPKYIIFTASGPTEIAEEIEIDAGDNDPKERHGALSYFLLQALISLRRSGINVSSSSLYHHLLTKFHTYWPRQTPMRCGNRNSSFFGSLQFDSHLEFIPVFVGDDHHIYLDAGHAHDVHYGDEYALYPFDTSEVVLGQAKEQCQRLRVTSVGCLTAKLEPIQPTATSVRVQTGWKARLLTRFSASPVSVRVATGPRSQAEWLKASEHLSLLRLHLDDEYEGFLFNVTCNVHHEYEISGAKNARIIGVTPVSIKEPDAVPFVLEVLQHLANFKRFEQITNRLPDPAFEQSFNISLSPELGPTGTHQVVHGQELHFEIQNTSDKSLYVTLFDLRPSGQILNLMLESGIEFVIVEPYDTRPLSLRMQVPETMRRRGDNECEDIMKFFLARKGLYFPPEVLPEISQLPSSPTGGSRDGQYHDGLTDFLLELESKFRGSGDTAWNSHWTTRDIVVCTVQE